MKRRETREFYNQLAGSKRAKRGLSCGFQERYDPGELLKRPEILAQLRVIIYRSLAGYKIPLHAVLDAGAGTFFYHEILEDRFEQVFGLDCSKSMLSSGGDAIFAKAENRTVLCCGEVEHLPFPDNFFDCVFGMDVIHHLENPTPVLSEAHRVLAPGGIFLGIEPNMQNPGMFLAHLLPAEERGALRSNWPGRLRSLLSGQFQDVKLGFYNLSVASGFSEKANFFFPFSASGGRGWSLRMVITGKKAK